MKISGSSWLFILPITLVFIQPSLAQNITGDREIIGSAQTGTDFPAEFYTVQKKTDHSAFSHYNPDALNIPNADTVKAKNERKTTSLTVGYLTDVFSIQGADGSYRYRFDGQTTGLKLSSKSSSLMLSYGIAPAQEHEGDIRSITADVNLGGNITLFQRFLGLPIEAFIPIRFNFGYRNLELLDNPDRDLSSTANIGTGSLGGGLGAQIRIPTGLPVLKDNITAFAHLVKSAGAIGDFESLGNSSNAAGQALGGIRLTKGTDLTVEAKFERLLGGNTGVTAGMTVRWMHWTDDDAENFKQILDVVSGEQEGLELRATQSFFRVGINW